MVYLSLNKEFFEKNIKKMNQEAITELGEEEGKNILQFSDEFQGYIDEIDGNLIDVTIEHPNLGNIYIPIKLDDDDYIKIIENVTKRLNKFKSLVESMKNIKN